MRHKRISMTDYIASQNASPKSYQPMITIHATKELKKLGYQISEGELVQSVMLGMIVSLAQEIEVMRKAQNGA